MSTLDFLSPANIQEATQFLNTMNLHDNEALTRAEILSCWESVDINACPGSGKTAMLVANIGWAVDHWRLDGSGICVLSHTNVAKDEIVKRLTKPQASKLFTWPNFVGTIHEFVNRYLALPFLRSNNKQVRVVDNDLTYRKCLQSLQLVPGYSKSFIRSFSHCNYKLKYQLTNLNWYINSNNKFAITSSGKTPEQFHEMLEKWSQESGCYPSQNPNEFYEFLKKIKQQASKDGFHSHADMFAFAKALLNSADTLNINKRFPLVFVDESQDTNEMQSALLSQILDPMQVIVQRFGDSDQQIFDFGEKAQTDYFTIRVNNDLALSETRRCSQPISTAASKLSLSKTDIIAVANGCQILPHIILFDKDSVSKVIPKFLDLIKTNRVLIDQKSIVKVVGQTGKKPSKKQQANFPYSIWHYVPSYIKPNKKGRRQPKNLAELIFHCREQFQENQDNYHALNTFFAGMLRLIPSLGIRQTTRYPFREIRKALQDGNHLDFDGQRLFEFLLTLFNDITQTQLSEVEIKSRLETCFEEIGIDNYFEEFLEFDIVAPQTAAFTIPTSDSGEDVLVEINTIAGVKGETHTATLVLETFLRKHCIQSAIKAAFNESKPSENQQKQIKHLFVAMTRPEDFLCLALPSEGYDELTTDDNIKAWLDQYFAQPITA